MGLLSSPPKISLRLLHQAFAASTVEAEVDVIATGDTRTDFIDARVRGIQGWAVGSGKQRVTHREVYPDMTLRLAGPGTLAEGMTTFPLRVPVPNDLPPTHDVEPAYSHLEVAIHVSIPWQWDGRGKFLIPVRVASPPFPVPRTPWIGKDQAGQARLELGLASTRLIVGETLLGSCGVFHVADEDGCAVELSLVPVLELRGRGRKRERTGRAVKRMMKVPPGAAGRAVTFEFPVPSTATPSFHARTHSMAWTFSAAIGGLFGKKLSITVPVELVDATAAATTEPLRFAPRVADELVAGVLARFAATESWQIDDDDGGGPSIEREVGASVVRIAYRYRPEEGTYLVSRVDHPALGLALDVTPGSSLRHLFFNDLECGVADFDRAHRATARSHDQARPVVAAMAPAVRRCRPLGDLVRWNDDAMSFERAITDVSEPELAAMSAALVMLAHGLDPAIAAIEPPAALTVDRAAWTELATWLRGALTVGDLSIDGQLGDLPVDVRLLWDDDARPTGLRVAVGSPDTASAALRGVTLSLARPAPDALGHPTAERLVPLLVAWPTDLADLQIADGVAAATWRLPLNATADAARVRTLVEALRALLATLEPSAGPYR